MYWQPFLKSSKRNDECHTSKYLGNFLKQKLKFQSTLSMLSFTFISQEKWIMMLSWPFHLFSHPNGWNQELPLNNLSSWGSAHSTIVFKPSYGFIYNLKHINHKTMSYSNDKSLSRRLWNLKQQIIRLV